MKYDDNRRCPKCNQTATTRHEKDPFGRSRMRRECIRCGYVWHEEPLDADGSDGPGYRLVHPLDSEMGLFR